MPWRAECSASDSDSGVVRRAKYSYAIVFLNRRTDGTPSEVSVTLKELGLDNPAGYHIEDLYDDHVYGIVTPDRR